MKLLTTLIIISIICLAVYLYKGDKSKYDPKKGSTSTPKKGDKGDNKHEEIN